MADIIPVSRFREFIVNAVAEAYNAKARLMTGTIPIVTDEFTLQISGVLVDDVGGKGINEIEILQKSRTPTVTETTENASPVEITKTVVAPETSTTSASDQVADDTYSDEANASRDDSTETSSETGSDQSEETQQEQQDQEYGRYVKTETRES